MQLAWCVLSVPFFFSLFKFPPLYPQLRIEFCCISDIISGMKVRFINLERTKLPAEILKHNLEEKRKYFSDICLEVEESDAEVQVMFSCPILCVIICFKLCT